MKAVYSVVLLLTVVAATGLGDTFTHRSDGTVYHGYATQTVTNGKTLVHTLEKGAIELTLHEFLVLSDAKGRNPVVSVIPVIGGISYEMVTAAIESAIVEESNKGPLFILIEIDSPGGRTDLAERICSAILNTGNCRTVAYIHGRAKGGAYSAAAAVALACNEIYMAPAANIGAAAQYVRDSDGHIMDLKEAYGDSVGEKFQSVWRNYLASLAQLNGRPEAMARAMVDINVEVLEIERGEQTLFIDADEKRPGDQVVRVRCRKGEILTLSAANAVSCRIANGVFLSREQLLRGLAAGDAAVAVNNDIQAAEEELDRVINRFNRLNSALDLKYKELNAKVHARSLTRSVALKDFQEIVRNAEFLIRLKKNYPDVPVPEEALEAFLNAVKADYQAIRAMR